MFIIVHSDMTQACIIMTTYPNKGRELQRLIKALVQSGAASCVQRINYMKSYYMREGKFEKKEEKLLLIKTDSTRKEKAIAMLKKQHPYDIPEIMVLHPDEVDASYLSRLTNS